MNVIVFDFDGTLANTLPLAIKCINQLVLEYGYKPLENKSEMEVLRESSTQEIISKRLGLWAYQLPGYAIRAKKIFNENLKDVNIFDGIKALVQELATKYELAIISSNSQEAVRQTLKNRGILSTLNRHGLKAVESNLCCY